MGAGPGAHHNGIELSGTTPAVTVAVAKQEGINAVAVAERVIERFAQLEGTFIPQGVEVTVTRNYGATADTKAKKLISKLTEPEAKYSRVHQTTQFVVGASDETDKEIVTYSWGLYKRMGLSRVYFSAYQRGLGDPDLPGERSPLTNADLLNREHRLYQTDWLIRKYGFSDNEIPFESDGNLSLTVDPKELWAVRHPELFPIDINHADKYELLRVPGLGPVTVNTILRMRKNGSKIRSMDSLGKVGKRLAKAKDYVKFGY
jgi:predicted DNA-binding helix-hairpin-helix protein